MAGPVMPDAGPAFSEDAGEKIVLEPIIVVAPPPEEEPCGGGSCGEPPDPGDGGGSGGPTNPLPGEPTYCDPSVDPDCEQPLTPVDKTTINTALGAFLRDLATVADTTARRQCGELRNRFDEALGGGDVFRGESDSHHYGATWGGRIHFDPFLLDGAQAGNTEHQRELANTALHEAAHLMGFRHPAGVTFVDGQDYYSDPPFNLLSPGTNSCIQY